jgi:hypothetical protein
MGQHTVVVNRVAAIGRSAPLVQSVGVDLAIGDDRSPVVGDHSQAGQFDPSRMTSVGFGEETPADQPLLTTLSYSEREPGSVFVCLLPARVICGFANRCEQARPDLSARALSSRCSSSVAGRPVGS